MGCGASSAAANVVVPQDKVFEDKVVKSWVDLMTYMSSVCKDDKITTTINFKNKDESTTYKIVNEVNNNKNVYPIGSLLFRSKTLPETADKDGYMFVQFAVKCLGIPCLIKILISPQNPATIVHEAGEITVTTTKLEYVESVFSAV